MPHSVRATRILRSAVLAAAVLTGPALLAGPARADDLFYDATLALPVGDDARFFLNLTNRHYAPPQPVAVDIVNRCARPADDFPVVMLLAEASGRDPGSILSMRLGGNGWSAIFASLNVPHDVLFTGLDHDPGPPYGNGWGRWKNYKGSPKKFVLPDDQIVALAKLQTVSAYYRVSPYRVTSETSRGMTVEHYAVAHGRPVAEPVRKSNPGKGQRPQRGATHPGGHANPRSEGAVPAVTGGPSNRH
jgi:hypothetical protein